MNCTHYFCMLFTSDSSQLGAERGCTSWYNPQEVLQVVRYVKESLAICVLPKEKPTRHFFTS